MALITGAAKRIGRACALTLARTGCDLILTYKSSADEALTTAEDIRAASPGAAVQLIELDLADLDAVDRLGASLAGSLPRLDILIHNASIYGPRPLAELDANHILDMYRINAAAPLLLTRHLAPLLAKSPLPGRGAIVAMCDMHAMGRPRKHMCAYTMSKAALVEMVRSLARELAPSIRVNGIAPGVVAFPDSGKEADPQMQQAYLSRVPLGRSGTPEDAAEAVRWLAIDAHYTTGEIVRVDGGRWLA